MHEANIEVSSKVATKIKNAFSLLEYLIGCSYRMISKVRHFNENRSYSSIILPGTPLTEASLYDTIP
jgi:hypothetical protein